MFKNGYWVVDTCNIIKIIFVEPFLKLKFFQLNYPVLGVAGEGEEGAGDPGALPARLHADLGAAL